MSGNVKKQKLQSDWVDAIVEILVKLPTDRVMVVSEFIAQSAKFDDPDVLKTFVAFRRDPRLDSLLHLVSQFDDDEIDQVIFFAEDIFAQQSKRYK